MSTPVSEQLKTDYALYCANRADQTSRAYTEHQAGDIPFGAGAGRLEEGYRRRREAEAAGLADERQRWQDRAAAARKGYFLIRGDDFSNPSYSTDKNVRKYYDLASQAGLVVDHT